MRSALALLALGISLMTGTAVVHAQGNPDWTRPFPPFRIIGNIYWAGSYDLSTYLITTPAGDDYARTFLVQKELTIDVWLASHAAQFRLHEKYKPGDPYSPDRFVDPQGFLEAVQRLEKLYLDQLAAERGSR